MKHPDFAVPGRKEFLKSDVAYVVIVIDTTETPIQRPKKQKRYYSGKKKKHTIKTQVVVDKSSKKVICTSYSNGRQHQFRVYKESKVRIHPEIHVLIDSGYQGLSEVAFQYENAKEEE